MAFGVFIHRIDSIYDDSPAERYQFPKQYLHRAQACVADWIIYYEPSKVRDSRGYYALARVEKIIPDPSAPNMYIALIEPGTYLDFARSVPFSGAGGVIERGVLNQQGRISGRAQAAVRSISSKDFQSILEAGLAIEDTLLPRVGEVNPLLSVEEESVAYAYEGDRERLRSITSRTVRDRVFRQVVIRAYDLRCAITGLKLINGRGRAEVEAAHIKPVEANGPDIVSNGIALSGTAHWMFDRGLISLSEDREILISRQVNDPAGIRAMINATGRALLPKRVAEMPHPQFLSWHRENCFKQ